MENELEKRINDLLISKTESDIKKLDKLIKDKEEKISRLVVKHLNAAIMYFDLLNEDEKNKIRKNKNITMNLQDFLNDWCFDYSIGKLQEDISFPLLDF